MEADGIQSCDVIAGYLWRHRNHLKYFIHSHLCSGECQGGRGLAHPFKVSPPNLVLRTFRNSRLPLQGKIPGVSKPMPHCRTKRAMSAVRASQEVTPPKRHLSTEAITNREEQETYEHRPLERFIFKVSDG